MAQRSLNKVMLIGNLTRDPELRYTPQGTAVCTLGLATNRSWQTDTGEKREETEFHRLVAWNKLAELCSQLLFKGRKIFVEGRLQTRQWTGQDGTARQTTEIVIDEMLILDSKRAAEGGGEAIPESVAAKIVLTSEATPAPAVKPIAQPTDDKPKAKKKVKKDEKKENLPDDKPEESDEVKPEDIPF